MTSTAIDRVLMGRMEEAYNLLGELMSELEGKIGIEPDREQMLRSLKPVVATPVGNLTADFKNLNVYEGRIQGYYRVVYPENGEMMEMVVRYEIGRNGRPVFGKALMPRVAK